MTSRSKQYTDIFKYVVIIIFRLINVAMTKILSILHLAVQIALNWVPREKRKMLADFRLAVVLLLEEPQNLREFRLALGLALRLRGRVARVAEAHNSQDVY